MEKKFSVLYSSFFVVLLLILQVSIAQPSVCDWRGYASINVTTEALANISHYVTSYTNGIQGTNGSIYSDGYYILHVSGSSGDNITLQICGVNSTQGTKTWACTTGYNTLNISINTSSTGSSCSYNCGCTNNYCVHRVCRAASTYCGDSYCDSGETCTSCAADCGTCPGGSTGGTTGGTTTGGTTTAVVNTTVTIPNASSTSPGVVTVDPNKSADLKVDEVTIEVNGTASGAVTIKESSLPAGANIAISTDAGAVYKYLDITTTVPKDKIESVKIKFKVEKSWLTSNNIDPSTISLQRYVNNQWTKLPTTKLSEDDTYIYYEAESPGLSIFSIIGEKATTLACPYECCVSETGYTNKACASVYECKNRKCVAITTPTACPTCAECTDWSECIDSQQTRTCFKCSADTGYKCQASPETKTCVEKKMLPIYIGIGVVIVLGIILWILLKRKKPHEHHLHHEHHNHTEG